MFRPLFNNSTRPWLFCISWGNRLRDISTTSLMSEAFALGGHLDHAGGRQILVWKGTRFILLYYISHLVSTHCTMMRWSPTASMMAYVARNRAVRGWVRCDGRWSQCVCMTTPPGQPRQMEEKKTGTIVCGRGGIESSAYIIIYDNGTHSGPHQSVTICSSSPSYAISIVCDPSGTASSYRCCVQRLRP